MRGLKILFVLSLILNMPAPVAAQEEKPVSDATSPTNSNQPVADLDVKPKLTQAAKQRLREEFDRVREDSELSEWQKIDPSKTLPEKAGHEEKIRYKKKLLELLEFCNEERFQTLGAVDELDYLTASDKQVCKDRLKLLNPFIE